MFLNRFHMLLGSDGSLTTVFGTVELVRMGYSRPQRAEHISPRHGTGLARTVVLLRTPAPPGQGRPTEPVSGIGSDPCRVHRRFRLQTQSPRCPSRLTMRLRCK